jgi:predicted SnoaL-like aldol condensation-catalyzing enzyme
VLVSTPEENVRAACEFLELALVHGNARGAVARYVAATYRQHSPGVADGVDAFVSFAEDLHLANPGLTLDIRRTIAQGDLVALHTVVDGLSRDEAGVAARPKVAVDLYRFNTEGRIVEHWEVIQDIPETSANANGIA